MGWPWPWARQLSIERVSQPKRTPLERCGASVPQQAPQPGVPVGGRGGLTVKLVGILSVWVRRRGPGNPDVPIGVRTDRWLADTHPGHMSPAEGQQLWRRQRHSGEG